MQVDSTGTRLAPRQFNSAAEVMENAARVLAFRKSLRPPPCRPQIIDVKTDPVVWTLPCTQLSGEVVGRLQGIEDPTDAPANYLIVDIIRVVSWMTGVSKVDILSPCKTAKIVRPRSVGMMLCKHLTNRSFPEIGRKFGGRDHSTIIHAFRKMQPVLEEVVTVIPEGSSIHVWVDASLTVHDRLFHVK